MDSRRWSFKKSAFGANLVTDQTFTNFKLHIEFRYPKESNSGVYLRGRYEVQVEDEEDISPAKDKLGAVYGFIEPSEKAGKSAGEWQTYDITLVGRMVTVMLNGKTVICNREIPGITGGAINSREGERDRCSFKAIMGRSSIKILLLHRLNKFQTILVAHEKKMFCFL
jgi:hypothetical protein